MRFNKRAFIFTALFLIGISSFASAQYCLADFNSDNTVSGTDLAVLLGAWGNVTNSTSFADLNGDLLVNGVDLSLLQGAWGQCINSSLPDLVVQSISTSFAGNSVIVSISFKNIGDNSSSESWSVVNISSLSGQYNKQQIIYVPELAVGQVYSVNKTFSGLTNGTYVGFAKADFYNQINELNESNNIKSFFSQLAPPQLPNLKLLTWGPAIVYPASNSSNGTNVYDVAIKLVVNNSGQVVAPNSFALITFYSGSNNILNATYSMPSFGPGQTIIFYPQFYSLPGGNYTAIVNLDYWGSIVESNEQDNFGQYNFVV